MSMIMGLFDFFLKLIYSVMCKNNLQKKKFIKVSNENLV
jgi:hypothetical protein